MFQEIVGSILLVFTTGLLVKYRPKTFLSWYLCLLSGWWFMDITIAANCITNYHGNVQFILFTPRKSICSTQNKVIARTETTHTGDCKRRENKKTSKCFKTTGNGRNETLCIIKRTRLFGNA